MADLDPVFPILGGAEIVGALIGRAEGVDAPPPIAEEYHVLGGHLGGLSYPCRSGEFCHLHGGRERHFLIVIVVMLVSML